MDDLLTDNRRQQDQSSSYSVIIRTFNSANTIADTFESLSRQSISPTQYVVVDSGSTDNTLEMIPDNATVRRYVGDDYNYSDALNQGIESANCKFTLIISSHTSLLNPRAIEYAISHLNSPNNIAAAYFLPGKSDDCLSLELISSQNFTGFNGVFNTCGLYETQLLKRRRFKSEVFSAEDQEWSKWLLEIDNKLIARISGGGMNYRNPIRDRRLKDLYEELAVAFYVKKEMFELRYLFRLGYRVVRPYSSWKSRCHNLNLLSHLIYYRIVGKPGTLQIFARK